MLAGTFKKSWAILLSLFCATALSACFPWGPSGPAADKGVTAKAAEPDPAAVMSMQEVRAIALADSGIDEEAAELLRCELETPENIYEIDFYYDGKEYDYRIDAVDGTVLSRSEEDAAPGYMTSSTASEEELDKDEALVAALDYVGLTAEDITGLRVDRDSEDGRYVYELQFFSGGSEFELEIDGRTGEVLSYEREP